MFLFKIHNGRSIPDDHQGKGDGKEINRDGLELISYKVSPNKIEIEFLFAGGVTTLEMEQQGENVKRVITHNAD